MRILLFMFLIPIALAAVALAAYAVPLPGPFSQPFTSDRNLFAAIVTGLFGMASLAGLAAFTMHEFARAGSEMDAPLAGLGLDMDGRQMTARHYSGELLGRPATAMVHPAYVFQPFRVEVTVQARTGMRAAIGDTRPLLECRECARASFNEPRLDALHVHPADPAAMAQWLADPAIRGPLMSFLDGLEGVNSWELYILPDKVWARVRTYRLNPDQAAGWVLSAGELARASEASSGAPGGAPSGQAGHPPPLSRG